MSKVGSFSRFTKRLATAPWWIEDTRRVVELERDEIQELTKRVELMSQTQLDALSLLTRAIDELNSRIQTLESPDQRPA